MRPQPTVRPFDPVSTDAPPQAESLAVLLQALAQALAAGPVELTIRIGGPAVPVSPAPVPAPVSAPPVAPAPTPAAAPVPATTTPAPAPSLATPVPAAAGRAFTPMEHGILDVLAVAERPMKQIVLARRMQQKNTPHFRSCCGRLRREGLLVYVVGRGYWRADREPHPVPDADTTFGESGYRYTGRD